MAKRLLVKRISDLDPGNYEADKSKAFFPASVGTEQTFKYPLDAMEQVLANQIIAEANRATAAETNLQGQIDTVNAAIDAEVMTDMELASDEDSVEFTNFYRNLKTGLESQSAIAMPTVSQTTAGAMDSAMFVAFEQYGIDITEIKSMLTGLPRKVIASELGASPSQQQLTAAFNAVYDGAINPGDEVVSVDTSDVWIMGNSGIWIKTTQADMELASEGSPGLAKHSALDGCVGYFVAGVGQVNGWSDLKAEVAENTGNIEWMQANINQLWNFAYSLFNRFLAKYDSYLQVVNSGSMAEGQRHALIEWILETDNCVLELYPYGWSDGETFEIKIIDRSMHGVFFSTCRILRYFYGGNSQYLDLSRFNHFFYNSNDSVILKMLVAWQTVHVTSGWAVIGM